LESDDGEMDDDELTHFGTALSKLDDDVAHHDPRLEDEDPTGRQGRFSNL
jgi:hypothetical protein